MPTEERSLAGETADGTTPQASPFGTPNPTPGEAPPIEIPTVSIIDNILQLDSAMSGEVRRAEKTARFCTKAHLEADIDRLEFELQSLVDAQGNPLPLPEVSVGEQVRTARQVALEIQTLQAEMGAAFVYVRLAQLPSDKWAEFKIKWREAFDKPAPYPNDMYDDLIGVSAKTPSITAEQAAGLRTVLGDPQMDVIASAAWEVNQNSGVSIPKSRLSSLVLSQTARSKS